MRRFGHEGFPVVETDADGHETLIGVLTRRDADRALDHGLGDQPVRRFMRAGQVTVRPDDSVAIAAPDDDRQQLGPDSGGGRRRTRSSASSRAPI